MSPTAGEGLVFQFLQPKFWPGFWRTPHRPLMLCSVLAALAGPLLAGTDPQLHARLLIFGFAGAAIGAYLLTVLPGWTKERATPARIGLLTLLWVLGRLMPGPIEALYFIGLSATLAPAILRAGVFSRLWAPLAPALLALATLLPDLPTESIPLLLAALIATVGARALPAFLASATGHSQPANNLALYHTAPLLILGTAVLPHPGWLLLAGLVLLCQMLRWPLLAPPLDAMLLPPWLWLITSLLMMATSAVSPSFALHMLTIGAISGMIHAFLSRIFALRTASTLIAQPASLIAAAALHAATFARLMDSLTLALVLWTICWGITLIQLITHCRRPPQIPVFVGSRKNRHSQTKSTRP